MKRNPAFSKLVVISGLLLLFSSPVIAGNGPGNGDCDGTQDRVQDRSGDGERVTLDTLAVPSLLLAGKGVENKGSGENGGYGPGDGTGNDGDGPQDGTGKGPGDCDTV